jgi:hypothetical protein
MAILAGGRRATMSPVSYVTQRARDLLFGGDSDGWF